MDRAISDRRGDEYIVNFSDKSQFALQKWEDAVSGVKDMLTAADREHVQKPREWKDIYEGITAKGSVAGFSPSTRRLLNHISPLPRALYDLVTRFVSAIRPLEAKYNEIWGLMDLTISLSCASLPSTENLARTAGWSKKLRSVVELFNRCFDACEDKNEALYEMADVLENVLQILGESVRHLRNSPTDMEATRNWQALEVRISENLTDIDRVVRHVNDITSYSMANLERQAKNLKLRHAMAISPVEYSKFPIHMVRRPKNLEFYGRDDELKRIDNYLNPKESKNLLRTYTLYGRRGVGKTDIALEYAHLNPAGFEAIFWIQCETSITLRQSFTDMACELNLPGADQNSHHEENQMAVLKWLKETSRTWLLIFDNAEQEQILKGYWPLAAPGAILITSRKYYNFTLDAQRKGETVKVFTEAQSWALLMKLLGPDWQDRDRTGQMRPSEDRAAKSLLQSLGGLALAIQQAAQLIKNPKNEEMSISFIYESFLRHMQDLPHSLSGPRQEVMEALDTLWSITFGVLSQNARDLLGVLSLLSPDKILLDILLPRNQQALNGRLKAFKQHPDHVDATSQATLSNIVTPPHLLQQALDELLRVRLINREGGELWVHRVVQEAMNYHSFAVLQDSFDAASALVHDAFPEQQSGDYLTAEQRGACSSYVTHAAHLSLQYARYHRDSARGTLAGSLQFVQLLRNAAWYLYEVSDYEICLKLVETGWMACDNKRSLEYAVLCNIAGCAYYEINKLSECRKYWAIFSEIQELLLPDDHIDRSVSYHNLGNLESATGNIDEAMNYFKKAIAIRGPAGDSAVKLLANSHICLSRAHFLRGEYKEALNALALSESLLSRSAGKDDHFMAHVHYAYGNIEFQQKRWITAQKYYDASLRIGLATAAIHPIVAAAYYRLGCVQFELRRHDRAKDYLDKALTIAKIRSPSRDDGTMARIFWKTSVVLSDNVVGGGPEAEAMRLRAEIALRKLNESGEGGLVVAIDEDENADPVEFEALYDQLVPGFFR